MLYMDTEELTSFFKIVNKNQKGGSILESIETKKFSMYGGEEKKKEEESFDKKLSLIVSKMEELKEKHNQLMKEQQNINKDSENNNKKLQSDFDKQVKDNEDLGKKLEEMTTELIPQVIYNKYNL